MPTTKAKKKKKGTTDAVAIMDRRRKSTKESRKLREEARADGDVAQIIYDARTAAGLSMRELAAMVGTTASVICRLEDADYEGHSLAMLRRIADALDQKVEVAFVPQAKKKRPRKKQVGK